MRRHISRLAARPSGGAERPNAAGRGRFLPPRLRRLVLSAHVVVSVGWLGIVVAMLAVEVLAATTREAEEAAVAYSLLASLSDILVTPPPASFSLAALLTGVVLSLGTKWGLFKHYWVSVKLALTVAVILSGIFLVDVWVHQAVALPREPTSSAPASGAGSAPTLLICASIAHLLILGAATVISVHKPWGRIRRGSRDVRTSSRR